MENKKQNKIVRNHRIIFFGLFWVATGLIMSIFYSFIPLYKYHSARNWTQVPCKITKCELDTILKEQNREEYRLDVAYKYNYKGVEYQSTKGEFFVAGQGHLDRISNLAAKFSRQKTAFVNPRNPQEAVLNRDFEARHLLKFITPFIFLVIGILITFSYDLIYHAAKLKKSNVKSKNS